MPLRKGFRKKYIPFINLLKIISAIALQWDWTLCQSVFSGCPKSPLRLPPFLLSLTEDGNHQDNQ